MKTLSRFGKWLASPRVLRNAFLIFAVLGSLIALFYAFENWRGATNWAEVVALRKSRSIPTDRRDIIPARPPDSDNFCAIPILRDYPKNEPERRMKLDNPESKELFPNTGIFLANSYPPLAAIASYYRKEPSFPQSSPTASDAETILAALGKYQKERNELVQALGRPGALFSTDLETEEPWAIALPHIGRLINISRALGLHAMASLAAGKNREALEDIQIQFRLMEALSREPLLISQLGNSVISNNAIQSIWYGLGENKWSAAEVQTLATLLRSVDLLASGQLGMRGEEILFFYPAMDFLKKASPGQLQGFLKGVEATSENVFERSVAWALWLMPSGCYDESKVIASPMFQDYLINSVDPKGHRIFVSKILAGDEAVISKIKKKFSPANIFPGIFFPAISTAWQNLALSQCRLDMGLIACELELQRRKEGRYPESLSGLGAALPNDPITGEPYHYQLTPNNRYRLWSAGWNLKDENGTVAYKDKEKQRPDKAQGDWVWAYPE